MSIKQLIGLDNLSQEYAYERSDATGYTSAKKIADRWVPATCGYCSVGCGIEIGVKQGYFRGQPGSQSAVAQQWQAGPSNLG